MDERAKKQIQEAKDVLSDAEVLRRGGGRDESIVNRLYYASFHAAQAALHTRGFDPSTHGGVVEVFGRELIEKGEATRNDGRFLHNLQDERDAADYNLSYDSLGVDIEARFARTETFIADMETIVESE